MAVARTLRRPLSLRITADADCKSCVGTGFNIAHEYSGKFTNTMKVEITVCPCVRLDSTRKHKVGEEFMEVSEGTKGEN